MWKEAGVEQAGRRAYCGDLGLELGGRKGVGRGEGRYGAYQVPEAVVGRRVVVHACAGLLWLNDGHPPQATTLSQAGNAYYLIIPPPSKQGGSFSKWSNGFAVDGYCLSLVVEGGELS